MWHTLFGVEEDIDALLSPTHLILGLGALLMASGPLVAAWQRLARERGSAERPTLPWPGLMALGIVVSTISFFTAFANPFALPLAAGAAMARITDLGIQQRELSLMGTPRLAEPLGVASLLVVSAIIVSAVLLAVLRWRLPLGALVVLFLVGVATSATPHESPTLAAAALGAGLAADALAVWLRPGMDRPQAVVWFESLAPAALATVYLVAIGSTVGIAWPPELWLGSILLAGAVGAAFSLVMLALLPVGPDGPQAIPQGGPQAGPA